MLNISIKTAAALPTSHAPMLVDAFSHLKVEDVDAILEYVRTLKPVNNVAPAYKPLRD